jgi:flagellar motor switch protein FliM
VDVDVELGRTMISPRDLASLKPGNVVLLDKDINDPLVVNVQNLPKFHCRPGKIKDNLAIDIVNTIDRKLY